MSAKLLAFCFRSLYREYGAAFLLRVVLAHPVATVRGIRRYARGETSITGTWEGGQGSLVGLGFCLKPLKPACPSGRANHRCQCLETGAGEGVAPCRDCLVREVGQQALAGGSSVYVMTSAQDMLDDVFRPALERRRFRQALLTMCRYSFEPIGLAMAICGIQARLIPFVHGDCRDYATWRQADMGKKPEQTVLDEAGYRMLAESLSSPAKGEAGGQARRIGNFYEPLRGR